MEMRGYTVIADLKTKGQVYTTSYGRALQLARTLYVGQVEVRENPKPAACPGCKELPVSGKQCSCWGYS